MTEFIKTMFEYFWRSVALSEQCRVKLTAGRVKSQGGVDGIADVITSQDKQTIKFLFFDTTFEIAIFSTKKFDN